MGAEPESGPPEADADEPWPTFGYDLAAQQGVALRPQAAVPPHLAPGQPRHAGVPAVGGLRQRVHRAAEGALLRGQRQDRQAGVQDQELQALRGLVAHDQPTAWSTSPTWTSRPARRAPTTPTGFLIAMDAETGRTKWRYRTKPVESSPLLRNGILYVGSWDGNVHAIRAKTGRARVEVPDRRPRSTPPRPTRTGASSSRNQAGTLYALNARTGRLAWKASQATEFFYAAPAVAYGRVFIGSTDGTMYAYGAAHRQAAVGQALGTYIYSSAAIYDTQGLRRHLRRQAVRARRRHRRRALAAGRCPAPCTGRRW